jgi:hypothetical protein
VIAAVLPPRPVLTAAGRAAQTQAEREAEAKARAAEWERRQEAEWRERVAVAHAALVAKLTSDGCDDVGFMNAGSLPVINVTAGEWTDLFGTARGRLWGPR